MVLLPPEVALVLKNPNLIHGVHLPEAIEMMALIYGNLLCLVNHQFLNLNQAMLGRHLPIILISSNGGLRMKTVLLEEVLEAPMSMEQLDHVVMPMEIQLIEEVRIMQMELLVDHVAIIMEILLIEEVQFITFSHSKSLYI